MNVNERKSSAGLDCDVGLGLKMPLQATESYTSDVGGGPLFSYTTNRVADCVPDVYRSANAVVMPRTFQYTAFRAPAPPGGMSGKALFTESQWQELERQNMIHKYLSASVPVPHQLLFSPSSTNPAQSNIASGLELRFGTSGGSSDPEPWRCKRTDGKKWRCSRDVATDQKYCERHAHKTKSRSRKHVEIASNPPPPISNRSIEWFMRGGGSSTTTTPVPASKQQQWQQQITQITPDKDKTSSSNRNAPPSFFQPPQDYEDKQGYYVPDTSNLHKHHKMDSSHTTQTTRHFFIDSWEKNIGFEMGLDNKEKNFLPSSLSLSMSGENNNNNYGHDHHQDDESGHLGSNVCWMNVISAAGAAPGGPLGEALCLGNASATWGGLNLASPLPAHGYSNNNSNNTNSSSCSKSSCEDGSQALNFIG